MAQPRVGFLVVDLGGLNQAVDLGTGGSAFGRIAEQPCLASDQDRLYRSFGGIVVDGYSIGDQSAALNVGIMARLRMSDMARPMNWTTFFIRVELARKLVQT